MENNKVLSLLEKYNQGLCTQQEAAAVEGWYNSHAQKNNAEFIEDDIEQDMALVWGNINQQTMVVRASRVSYLRWLSIAATVVMIFAAGIIFYLNKPKGEVVKILARTTDIKPGKNGATLTLSNGKKIYLSSTSNGELAKEAGISIRKTSDGSLMYEVQSSLHASSKINTIATAKGETYQLRLPDGTNVWLNAASSLTFAANLYQNGIRKVELAGEAYFEVAKDKKHPFFVESNKQTVEVLGTHFNINAYQDESVIKTTLLEGVVRLNHQTVLRPDEQATLHSTGKVEVESVDINEVIAWKNGKFIFNSEDITSVMRKLSRWYNVQVIYQNDQPSATFTGVISRYDNISKILDKINYTGAVHLTIEGRRIIVMP